MSSVAIKQAIKNKLDTLVTAGTLAAATISDLKTDPLNADTQSWPHAYLMPPSIESEPLDNANNVRTYIYDIMILWSAENIQDATTVEACLEAIMNAFDSDITLGGAAIGGVPPVSSAPQPYQHASGQRIMAVVQITAKEPVFIAT